MRLSKKGIITIATVLTLLLTHAICVLTNELKHEKKAKEELMIEVMDLKSELESIHFDNQALQEQIENLEYELSK
jgi:uncharacterized protein YlxW (UPF0749 family)